MQFWVKDSSVLNLLNPQRMLLYTVGNVCSEFFNNIAPCNLYMESNKKYMYQIERFIRYICRYNVVIDAMVEKIDDQENEGQLNAIPAMRLVDCKLAKSKY